MAENAAIWNGVYTCVSTFRSPAKDGNASGEYPSRVSCSEHRRRYKRLSISDGFATSDSCDGCAVWVMRGASCGVLDRSPDSVETLQRGRLCTERAKEGQVACGRARSQNTAVIERLAAQSSAEADPHRTLAMNQTGCLQHHAVAECTARVATHKRSK